MAMNKKEKAAMERANMLAALRWTAPVKTDVRPPTSDEMRGGKMLSVGFIARGPVVEQACSSSVYHGIGSHTKTTSQNPLWLWSTPLLALRAERHKYEVAYAKALAKFDAEIAKHEQGGA